MKKFILLLSLLPLLAMKTGAQVRDMHLYLPEKSARVGAKAQIYVSDSIYEYFGYKDTLWRVVWKNIIVEYNSAWNETKSFDYLYDTLSGSWVKSDYVEISYYNDTLLHSFIVYYWDNQENKRGDTAAYRLYDDQGHLIVYMYKAWDAQNRIFLYGEKEKNEYDSHNLLIKTTKWRWDVQNNAWVGNNRVLYEYNDNGELIHELHQQWANDIWENDKQYFMFYDDHGNKVERDMQRWINGAWVMQERDTFEYNTSGYLTTHLFQTWDTSSQHWLNNAITIYTYDANGNIISDLYKFWDITINDWVNSGMDIYQYDSDNKLVMHSLKMWNNKTQQWIWTDRYIYEYDSAGNKTRDLQQSWHYQDSSWANASQTMYSYNSNGQILEQLSQRWNQHDSAWVNDKIYLHEYNDGGYEIKYEYRIWNVDSGYWNNGFKYEYYCSKRIFNAVPEIASGTGLRVYPNPAGNILYLSWGQDIKPEEIYLIDIRGRVIVHKFMVSGNALDISGLSPGVYFVRVKNKGSVRFIKR